MRRESGGQLGTGGDAILEVARVFWMAGILNGKEG